MSFLSFIKDRQAQQPAVEQQSQQPETAKQMYTREAIEEKANQVAPTPDQEERARAIGDEMLKSNQPAPVFLSAPVDAPTDQGSNAAHLQNQNNQDKAQPALSPTDSHVGKTALEETSQEQNPTTGRTQNTIARPAPSWER
jgi:hypothetical protein